LELLEGLLHVLGWVFGWPLRLFRRWLDRQPDRDPSRISTLHKIGRLALGGLLCLLILTALAWFIWE
jgi:hypothetical protein